MNSHADAPFATLLRRAMLALVLLGAGGLAAELLLLEHYEDPWQWTPLVLLVVAMPLAAWSALRPSRASIRLLRATMALCIAAGALGVWLHYQGNLEFELERDPSLRGVALFWETIRGATPALAPGAMVQLGLLGLLATFRHPALRSSFQQDAHRASTSNQQAREPR